MRAGFFQGRFVLTADNGLEEIGMKQQSGKLVRLEYIGRSRTNDGEKAGRLYFDFVEEEEDGKANS